MSIVDRHPLAGPALPHQESKRLKIVFFVARDMKAGTYFVYHNFAIGLVQRGHEVTIFSQSPANRRGCREETRDGVRYILAPSVPGNSFVAFYMNPGNILCRFLTHFRYRRELAGVDVMHLFQAFENSSYPCFWELNRRRRHGKKILFAWEWDDLWCGGLYRLETMSRWQDRRHYRQVDKLEHELPRRADVVTTLSTYLANLARKRGARKTELIYNGFWPALAENAEASRRVLRQQLGLNPDAFYLAFTGFTLREFDWCLDVLENLEAYPNVRLLFCGGQVDEAVAARPPALARRIDNMGHLSSAETRSLLAVADVALLPMDRTPFNESRLPFKFTEYLASGLPVLCSDVGEAGLLGRKLKGVVLLPDNRAGWVKGSCDAVRDLLADSGLHRPDPAQLEDLFSWPKIAAQLENVYRRYLHEMVAR